MKLKEIINIRESAFSPGWSGSQRPLPAAEETFDETRYRDEMRGINTTAEARTSKQTRNNVADKLKKRINKLKRNELINNV